MSKLDQLRDSVSRLWDNVAEEWQELKEKTGRALTSFRLPSRSEGEPRELEVARRGSRWGLLAGEVEEGDREIVVRLEVPGMERDDFELEVVGNHLLVRGEKRFEREQKRGHYYLMERAYGSFERAVPLPAPVDHDGAKAAYRRGVLEVTLPKSPEANRRRIAIESG